MGLTKLDIFLTWLNMIVIVATDDKYSSDKLSFCIPARIWLWHDHYHHQQVNIRIE